MEIAIFHLKCVSVFDTIMKLSASSWTGIKFMLNISQINVSMVVSLNLQWLIIDRGIFFLVISQFNVNIDKELAPVLILTDNLGMQVPKNQFVNVLRTFHSGSMFYLNAELQPTNIKGATQIVTPMVALNSI